MTSRNEITNFTLREKQNLFLSEEGRDGRSYSYPHCYEEIPDIMEQEASSFIRDENQTNRKKKNIHVLVRDPRDCLPDEFHSSHVSQPPISFDHLKSPLNHCSSIDRTIHEEYNIDESPLTPIAHYEKLLPSLYHEADSSPRTTTLSYKERSNTGTFMDQDIEKSNTLANSMHSFQSMNMIMDATSSEFNEAFPTRMRAESMHSFASFIYDDDDNDDFLDELLINDWWDENVNHKDYHNSQPSIFYGERSKSRCTSVDEISNFFASCGNKSNQESVTQSTRGCDHEYQLQCRDLLKCMRRTQKSRSKVVVVKENLLKHDSLRAKYSFRRELAYLGLNTVNTDASRNKLLRLQSKR